MTTGQTFNLGLVSTSYSNFDILNIKQKNGNEILTITQDGEIYYNFKDEMVKVECPKDIVDAFEFSILNYTGKSIDDVLMKKCFNYISSDEISNEHLLKFESAIRKAKLKKLNDDKNR